MGLALLGRSIHKPVFLENRQERRGLSEARGPAGLSIRISAFFSSSPQICRVRHLQQGISSNPYSCVCIHMVGKHRPGRANSKHVLHGETPTPSGQVCQSTSPGTLWQEPVSWPSLLSCAAVSLVVSAHVPMFSARHFPLGVSEHCSLGVPESCYSIQGNGLTCVQAPAQVQTAQSQRNSKSSWWPLLGHQEGQFSGERTLQTPCRTAATHLRFTKSAFLCGSKEKA